MTNSEKLKPPCVALSRSALQYRANAIEASNVIDALRGLQQTLHGIPRLDAKLADYVFFPLSIVFADTQKLSPSAIRLAVACLEHLVTRGWGQEARVDLCKQLFSLLNLLLAREQPDSEDQESIISVLHCLTSFLNNMGESLSRIYQEENKQIIPIIGQTLDSILTVLSRSRITKTQLAASNAARVMIISIDDRHILRNFLPGITSRFTKLLQESIKQRKPYRVIIACLQAVTQVLAKTVGRQHQSTDPPLTSNERESSSWEKASSIQLKQALANIVPLRYHEKSEVIETLFSLCITVLGDCKEILENCSDLMLDTAVVICSQNTPSTSILKHDLLQIVSSNSTLCDCLRSHLSSWLSSLPQAFESHDEQIYKRHVSKISTAYIILTRLEEDISPLYEEVTTSLKDSAATIFRISGHRPLVIDQTDIVEAPLALTMSSASQSKAHFDSLFLGRARDGERLVFLQKLLETLAHSKFWEALKSRFAHSLVSASQDQAVSSSWLLSRLINYDLIRNSNAFDLVRLGKWEGSDEDNISELALFYALEILCNRILQDKRDWRLEAIALEIIAYEAERQGTQFRSELIDMLFPIVERLGSTEPQLREHAMTCLDIVSAACDYSSVSELIIQNVDYMVNAVALKLGTSEIGPEVPRVLVMMLEIGGPSLIPYLDDLVNSVFSILSSFHAYPRLVESLFSVLNSMVDLDRQSTTKLLGISAMQQKKARRPPIDISEVIKAVRSAGLSDDDRKTKLRHSFGQDLDISDVPITDLERRAAHSGVEGDLAYVTNKKSYQIVLSILRLAEHYLAQGSPYLRQQLLYLVSSGCDSLHRNEDAFLPLINDIWPAVIKRLYDEEAIVCLAATKALVSIFQSAGDFVATRLEDEWQELAHLYRRIYSRTKLDQAGRGSRGKFSSSHKLWDGMVTMVLGMITFVRINHSMEDDVFDMLGPLITTRRDVREALELVNPDHVWLLCQASLHQFPGFCVDGFTFKSLEL